MNISKAVIVVDCGLTLKDELVVGCTDGDGQLPDSLDYPLFSGFLGSEERGFQKECKEFLGLNLTAFGDDICDEGLVTAYAF